MSQTEEWLKNKGKNVLQELGIKKGQKILDFGCGSGVYSIIAASIIGNEGKIFALDYDEDPLEELSNKIMVQNINNIEIIKTSRNISVPLKTNSLDVVLVYDVYHLIDKKDRINLLKEFYRILKGGNSFLSYHATHIGSYGIDLQEVHQQMKTSGFILYNEFEKPMLHWHWIEEGKIFNYIKF
jgi:ubiquinone/menaquinone biosynthesis C-methylase UbiE